MMSQFKNTENAKRSLPAFQVFLLLVVSQIAPSAPAYAIVNGKDATGSDYVVALIRIATPNTSSCSGAYVAPRVVITAAHCVIKANGGREGEFQVPIGQLYVSQPGADVLQHSRESLVSVLQIWTRDDYFNRWEPEAGLMETQVNDIAFLFLERELDGPHVDRLATKKEISNFRKGKFLAFHLGYGYLGKSNGELIPNDGKPYLAQRLRATNTYFSHIPRRTQLLVQYPAGISICPGDSGSPLLAKRNGKFIYLGTIYAGSSCSQDDGLDGNPKATGSVTVAWPYKKEFLQQTRKFLRENTPY